MYVSLVEERAAEEKLWAQASEQGRPGLNPSSIPYWLRDLGWASAHQFELPFSCLKNDTFCFTGSWRNEITKLSPRQRFSWRLALHARRQGLRFNGGIGKRFSVASGPTDILYEPGVNPVGASQRPFHLRSEPVMAETFPLPGVG